MNANLKFLIDNLPVLPGCYIMHDVDKSVIYVGKAKNLKNRVSQYFLRPQSGKVAAMVSNVSYFETIVTKNESEAFLLEYNLIHKYLPKYNILLKDDKHYPYIALRKKGIPELRISRKINDNRFYYFGPYPKSSSASEIVELLNQIFPLKKCRILPKKPCLYYHLNQCLGYCINKIDEETNQSLIKDVKSFLEGKVFEKEKEIKRKIKEASNDLNFELAISYKKVLDSIEHIATNQSIELNKNINCDCFAFVSRNNYLSMSLFIYRNGALIGKDSFIAEIFDNEIETAANLIYQYYKVNIVPEKISIFSNELYEIINELFENKVVLQKNGKYIDILNRLILNAEKSLQEYFLSARLDENKEDTLEELKMILDLKEFPKLIELFDNSHISGADAVSVSVAFINGEPCKKLYRKYKLKNLNSKSDIDNMKEVLERKLKRYKENNSIIPNLILIDGGLQQVKTAYEIINKYDERIYVYGLYKNDKHQTEGLIDINGKTFSIDHKSKLFLLLTSMQNEVHRFAITFFRRSHLKNYKKSILDDIPGLGEKRKSLIYDTYDNIDDLYKVDLNELKQLLPNDVAEKLFEKLHKNI